MTDFSFDEYILLSETYCSFWKLYYHLLEEVPVLSTFELTPHQTIPKVKQDQEALLTQLLNILLQLHCDKINKFRQMGIFDINDIDIVLS